ncbi:TcaA 3rd/4th domain-containing protein [Bacillus kwashiorkori]|uniref:TcaA 3rd/4th domain-containing protein n=1 Tax=Bacillus kwashiorkori TaxID=1522318 RepID=UPI0007813640|nr:hypothetical protein [Bacillus kwashiorkori]
MDNLNNRDVEIELQQTEIAVKKKKKWWIIGISTIVVLVGAITSIFLLLNKGPETLVMDWIDAVENNDRTTAYKLLTKTKEFSFSQEDVNRFLDFLKESPEEWAGLKSNLKDTAKFLKERDKQKGVTPYSKFGYINLQYSGKKWGILDSYQLVVAPVQLKLTTNQDDITWMVNEKETDASKNESFFPGPATVKAVFTNEYVSLDNVKEVTLFNLQKDFEEVKIEFEIREVTLRVEEKDADIVINEQETGLKTDGNPISLGLLPVDGSVKVYIKKDYPWGTMKSDPIQVKEPRISTNFYSIPEEVQNQIMEQANDLIEQHFLAIESFDSSVITLSGDIHKKAVEEIYKKHQNRQVKHMYSLINVNYDLSSFGDPFYNNGDKRYEIVLNARIKKSEGQYFQGLLVHRALTGIQDLRIDLYYDEGAKEWKFEKVATQPYVAYDYVNSKTYVIRSEEEAKAILAEKQGAGNGDKQEEEKDNE